MKRRWILGLTAFFPLVPVQAQQFEDLDALDGKIAAALGDNIARPIDRRLKLARCPEPVVLDATGSQTVVLRCYPIGWRIRVPTEGVTGSTNAKELLVRRGENVEIRFAGDNFEIISMGVATEDGYRGKRISVKSSTGNNALVATVTGEGAVNISD